MDEADSSKLNIELAIVYQSWLRLEEHGWTSGHAVPPALQNGNTSLLVGLSYAGDLAPIEAAGFETVERISEGVARGHVELRDLAAITRVPEVGQLKFGGLAKANLDTSALAIRARGSSSGLTNGLWHFNSGGPSFTGNTGQDVVIGIVDSGIDFEHEFFRTLNGQDTRILAIWDQALTPNSDEHSPDVSLIATGTTYGVEYEAAAIKAAMLQTAGFKPVRHRDTPSGHGTHVAGIAAGNGRPGFENIGVAPRAKIIVVNFTPSQGNVTVGSSVLSNDDLLRDAIHYIRNKARTTDATVPVVINCSFGSEFGPHDGRSEGGPPSQEDYLRTFRFDGSGNEIPGSAVIFSSGNYAGVEAHCRATLGSGALVIPFDLVDDRSTPNGSTLRIECWYPDDSANPPNLTFDLEAPDGTRLTNAGGATDPALLGNHKNMVFDTGNNKNADLYHFQRTANSPTYGSTVRNSCTIILTPFANSFLMGRYRIHVNGLAGTPLFIWSEKEFNFRPQIDVAGTTGSSPAAAFDNQSTCGSPGHCPDVITVANYDDTNNHLAYSSGRGPLELYGYTPPPALAPLFDKPNVAAPGTNINSAGDGIVKRCKCCRKVSVNVNFTPKTGTSMSCPHVTGLVALMLQKNRGLTQTQIKASLEANVATNNIRHLPDGSYRNWDTVNDASPLATATEIGSGKVDAKASVVAAPAPTA